MEKTPQIRVALLSSMLTICAHNAPAEGGLRYSAYIQDGNNLITSHHYAINQPHISGQMLVMDSSEIYLSDGAALLVAEFLKNTLAFVGAPRQLLIPNTFTAREVA